MAIMNATSAQLITHHEDASLDLNRIQTRLQSSGNLALPLEEELELLEQLTQFELGRFLLKNKGLNGYWTYYIILHGPTKSDLHPLEHWLLNKAPTVKATQERFQIFRHELQSRLQSGMTLASIPCGRMDDLLGLDYSKVSDIQLVGIDLDRQSLVLAQDVANTYGYKNVSLLHKDAWNLGAKAQYDIITSNGLNIYESDDQKVIELYKEFFSALRPNGVLITSFLTPPPALSPESSWKNYNPEDARTQKAIFGDIIGVAWQTFRTESKTREQLEEVGFKSVDIIYDSQGMFPTVVAWK